MNSMMTLNVRLVNVLIVFLSAMMGLMAKFRTAILQVLGIGFIDLAAFNWNQTFGYFAVGVSLLIIEALGGDE